MLFFIWSHLTPWRVLVPYVLGDPPPVLRFIPGSVSLQSLSRVYHKPHFRAISQPFSGITLLVFQFHASRLWSQQRFRHTYKTPLLFPHTTSLFKLLWLVSSGSLKFRILTLDFYSHYTHRTAQYDFPFRIHGTSIHDGHGIKMDGCTIPNMP